MQTRMQNIFHFCPPPGCGGPHNGVQSINSWWREWSVKMIPTFFVMNSHGFTMPTFLSWTPMASDKYSVILDLRKGKTTAVHTVHLINRHMVWFSFVFLCLYYLLSVECYDLCIHFLQGCFIGIGANHMIAWMPVKQPWRICLWHNHNHP